jgi:molybdate transport repressor ModE-like protein
MRWNVAFESRIRHDGVQIPVAETLAILDGIAESAALAGAARLSGLSYRAIWGKLAALEALVGRQLAQRTKGHGTRLTEAGQALRAALAASQRRLEPALAAEAEALSSALAAAFATAPPPPLVLAASHDPILTRAARGVPGLRVDIAGSDEALELLRAGRADIAGCHFGTDAEDPPPAVADRLRAEGRCWTVLFRRAQGLMLAPGNPLDIAGIPDLARRQARFVNRQRGSGTRAWFDRLLARHAIPPDAIRGYTDEEFTHHAVAAVIATGRADAGMGVQAAATEFGLDFRRLGEETYFLVFGEVLNAFAEIAKLRESINALNPRVVTQKIT